MRKKRLVVCFDGTWNSADMGGDETNVARIARAVRANSGEDAVPQLCLYLRGVGTSGSDFGRLFAGATGEGIGDTIRAGYRFLAQNYVPSRQDTGEEADEIYLFGFSRGAFAARSLAGWLGATGLLHRPSMQWLPAAWDFYRTAPERTPDAFLALHDRETILLHKEVAVSFLGVFDTVGALGVPVGPLAEITSGLFEFHNTEPSRIVRHGAHALAVDEHRDAFVPTLWTGKSPEGSVIEQVWFPGAHADVGGGYRLRELADIPLKWMAGRAASAGLKLDPDVLPGRLFPASPQHNSRSGLRIDRTPTIRCVCGTEVRVSAFERLWRPFDANGNARPTIGESLHTSLTERWGKVIETRRHDDTEEVQGRGPYRPKNLSLFFDGVDRVKPGVEVRPG
ncbi:MAG: DUF2235 domain-containing protein [Paracoccaceae bacterium]